MRLTLQRVPLQRLAAIVAACCALHGGLAQAREKIVVMVGGVDKLIYLPVALAAQLHYFGDEGLDVAVESQPAGVDAQTEMLAGAVQAVVGFYDHTIDLQTKGKEVASIAVFGLVPGSMEMVRADEAGRIASMGDLRGKTLGVTGLGSSSMFLGRYLTAKNGLGTNDYAVLPIGAGKEVIEAFKHKRVDVAWTTEPTTSQLRESGLAHALVDLSTAQGTRKALGGLYPASCLYVERSWLAGHREEAAKLARASVRALRFIATHTPEQIAEAVPPSFYGTDKDLYVRALGAALPMYSSDGAMPHGGPETVLKVLSSFNPAITARHVELSHTYTDEFVKPMH
jgi:NitT/TauT family transport system substrate-binding protein